MILEPMTTNKTSEFKLNTIHEAIDDIRNGKVIIVVDDENRENEGDFLAAAEKVTPEMINFMATHGRGLICTPLTETRCKELELNMMVHNNTDPMETAFTVSVDLRGNGVTTGISASDRAKTVEALVADDTKPFELGRPGHIFPLVAKEGGVAFLGFNVDPDFNDCIDGLVVVDMQALTDKKRKRYLSAAVLKATA
mgnify:CR=1 FL=1